jgi:hypothetical protein
MGDISTMQDATTIMKKELTYSISKQTNNMTALLSCPNINPSSKNDGLGN